MNMIGLDLGSKTIGVAASDALVWPAQRLTTIHWNEADITSADDDFCAIIKEHEIRKAIVGLPKNMSGTIRERGAVAQKYAAHLDKVQSTRAVLEDERS